MHNLTPTDMDPSVERRQRGWGGVEEGEMDGERERKREKGFRLCLHVAF